MCLDELHDDNIICCQMLFFLITENKFDSNISLFVLIIQDI